MAGSNTRRSAGLASAYIVPDGATMSSEAHQQPILGYNNSLSAQAPTPSNGGTNTMSSPASSVTGLPQTATPASSLMAETIDGTVPSSPPPRRNAWSKPRSWADLATHMGAASLNPATAFSENLVIGADHSTPSRSPSQSVTNSPVKRGRANGGGAGGIGRGQNDGTNGAAMPKSLGTLIQEAETQFSAPLTYPRGIINTGNMCFANAILQALVYCAPFYNLFHLVSRHVPHDFHNSTPLMEAVIQFLEEFQTIPAAVQAELHDSPALALDSLRPIQAASEPFVPDLLYDAMKLHKRFDTMRRGHQEDAEEFLGFFLDTLHEELQTAISKSEARLAKSASQSRSSSAAPTADVAVNADADDDKDEREVIRPASPSEGDGWLEVGQKGKTSFTRTTSTAHSPITRIFGGKLRSVLRTPGSKDSVTLEPCQPLQLDIQPAHVTTVEEALENLTVPETISGVISSAKHLVDATKQVYIETLPPVLVLHLKRFVYDDVGGVQKSSKVLGFGPTLEIAESVISPPRRGEVQRRYKLFAVVYHHGRYASGGHYTVDVLRQDRGEWLHIDDTTWSPALPPSSSAQSSASAAGGAPGASRSQQQHGGSAYLLFYAREDAMQASSSAVAEINGLRGPASASASLQTKGAGANATGSVTPTVGGVPGSAPLQLPQSPARVQRKQAAGSGGSSAQARAAASDPAMQRPLFSSREARTRTASTPGSGGALLVPDTTPAPAPAPARSSRRVRG